MNKRRAEESSETSSIRPHRLRGVEHNLINERPVKNIPNRPPRKRSKRLISLLALAGAVAASLWLLPSRLGGERVARAANPPSGTIAPTGPVPTFTGTWTGTATGTGSGGGETTCVEGVNCDSFRLSVAPGVYGAKQIAIKIQWAVAADDYDLYIHQCPTTASTIAQCNAGATVAQGENGGAPGTSDGAVIDPGGLVAAQTDYTIHVVYFATSGPADEYQGTASLESKATAQRSANYISGGINFSPSVAVKAPTTVDRKSVV